MLYSLISLIAILLLVSIFMKNVFVGGAGGILLFIVLVLLLTNRIQY